MGFNHQLLGYDDPQSMYEAFSGGVRAHADGMFSYFENTAALAAIQRGDYVGFAASYNGSGRAQHQALIRDGARAYERVRGWPSKTPTKSFAARTCDRRSAR